MRNCSVVERSDMIGWGDCIWKEVRVMLLAGAIEWSRTSPSRIIQATLLAGAIDWIRTRPSRNDLSDSLGRGN